MRKPRLSGVLAALVPLAALLLALWPGVAHAASAAAGSAAGLRREKPEECLIGGKILRCPAAPEDLSPDDKRARALARLRDASAGGAEASAGTAEGHPWPTGSTGPTTYAVHEGDTLWAISIHFGISVGMIMSANGLDDYDILSPGMVLDLPASNEPGAAMMAWDVPVVQGSGLHFVASISRQHCWLFRDRQAIGDWTCSTGRPESPSVPGNYTVQSKIERGYFAGADSWMPYWLGIYDAPGAAENGIHGLPYASDTGEKFWTDMIGQPVTFGCVMLADPVAQEIWQVAYVGMPVTVLR